MQAKPMNTRLIAPGAAGAPGVVGAKPMPFKATPVAVLCSPKY